MDDEYNSYCLHDSNRPRACPNMGATNKVSAGQPTTHAHSASSPKRKRTHSTSISAGDSSFTLPIAGPRPRASDETVVAPSDLPSHPHVTWSASFPPTSYLDRRSTSPTRLDGQDSSLVTDNYPDSPRSAVARKLEGLDLAQGNALPVRPFPVLRFGDAASRGGERKKVRIDADSMQDGGGQTLDHEVLATTEIFDPANVRAGSPTRASLGNKSHLSHSPHKPTGISKPKSKRVKSPPLPAKALDVSASLTNINWWTDAEITGHLGLDPEDDGYGINGVGFRPTAAMVAARSAKRRRQVDEWRTRELREERRRRAEGRRGRAGSADPGGGMAKKVARTVRFA